MRHPIRNCTADLQGQERTIWDYGYHKAIKVSVTSCLLMKNSFTKVA